MKKIFLISFIWTINLSTSVANASPIINLNTLDGINMLRSSYQYNDFYHLANFYEHQINPLYCSAATATMILNALNYGSIKSQKSREVVVPDSNTVIPYPLYTQDSFFNDLTDKIKSREIIDFKQYTKIVDGKKIYDAGVNLTDFSKMLMAYNLKVEKYHASEFNPKDIRSFRKLVIEVVRDKEKFIIANYDGQTIGQKTAGHISPIVAYNGARDYVLILDVALHKNPWFWVSIEDLYKSMNTMDGESFRGYLVVSK